MRRDSQPDAVVELSELADAFVGARPANAWGYRRRSEQKAFFVRPNETHQVLACLRDRGARTLRPAFEEELAAGQYGAIADDQVGGFIAAEAHMKGLVHELPLSQIPGAESDEFIRAQWDAHKRGLTHRKGLSALPLHAIRGTFDMGSHS